MRANYNDLRPNRPHLTVVQPQGDTVGLGRTHKHTQGRMPPPYLGRQQIPPLSVSGLALQQHHMCVDIGSTWVPLCRWFGPSVRSFLSNDNININMDNQDPAASLAAAVTAAASLVAADACPAAA